MKISDKTRNAVLNDYFLCNDLNFIAEKNGISLKAVEKIVEGNESVAHYIRNKNPEICKIIDMYINELANEERIKSAPLNQLVSALSAFMDKFVKASEKRSDSGQILKLIHGIRPPKYTDDAENLA